MRAPLILTLFSLVSLLLLASPVGDADGKSPGLVVIPGLQAPVRIVTDRFGIPHVRAQSLADLYAAWGYVTARDRLWQLEYSRRAGRGQLWRWFGNATLRGDGGAQLFRFRERAAAIWARDRADRPTALALERYAAGINAFIARCRAGAEDWPPEFLALGQRPEDWRPEDSVLLLLGLGVTLDLDLPELDEGHDIASYGLEWTKNRRRFEDQWIYDTIPDSAARRIYGRERAPGPRRRDRARPGAKEGDSAGRDDRVGDARGSLHEPAPMSRARANGLAPPGPEAEPRGGEAPLAKVDPALHAQAEATIAALRPESSRDGDGRASNVFAVGAKRSASGAPLFANDPHLTLSMPGPFHVIHVSIADSVDAIGASVPGLPTIVSGRNRRCAWGVTALSADMLDVYADTLSADGREAKVAGRWSRVIEAPYDLGFRVVGIPLPALGQVRRYTPHGPVVAFDRKRRVALAVRWSAMEDERISLRRMLGLERSRSATEIAARFRSLVTPGINAVAADRDGDVVYQAAGLVPRRRGVPPLGPLPGDGAHEWLGFIPPDSMPAWHVPPGGFVVNCNNRPVGPFCPDPWPRFDFAHDRAMRIAQRLAGDGTITLDDMRSVQNDVYTRAGERLVPLLLQCADSLPGRLTPRMHVALDTLRRWDFLARRGRVAPTLFRAWYGALVRRSRVEGLQGLVAASLAGRAPDALRAPGSEAPERPAAAAIAALDTALTLLERKLGPDLAAWKWGLAHRARFRHLPLGITKPAAFLVAPVVAEDGDASSPAVAPSRLPWSVDVTHGPGWRHVVNLAYSDSSFGVIPAGNSGNARSPHSRDHLQRWADHRYVPLYLAWDRIEVVRESETEISPGAPTGSR